MTRYDAILLTFALLLAALAAYFIYREWTDPILLPGGAEQPASVETETQTAPGPPVLPDSPDAPSLDAQPPASEEPSESEPSVDPEELQSSIEETVSKQVGQLAALMETRLAASLESAEARISEQSQKLESANQGIREALDTYQENTRLSLEGLSNTMGLIEEMQGESEAITSGLENARALWDQLFEDVIAIDQRSDDRMDEANFEFRTYPVDGAKSLSVISRELEAEYDLPESDLSYLLNRFNDIEYRLYNPGGRRPAYRVVANERLRVPVPKTAGTILKDYALPEKLRSQINHINQATSANTNLRNNLARQVEKLKQLESSVQAIASMSDALAQINLSSEDPLPGDTDLSPELQEAWQQFKNAASAYRSADGYEEEQLMLKELQQSITRLLKTYESNFLEASDTDENPLDYYLRFIEKYGPVHSRRP